MASSLNLAAGWRRHVNQPPRGMRAIRNGSCPAKSFSSISIFLSTVFGIDSFTPNHIVVHSTCLQLLGANILRTCMGCGSASKLSYLACSMVLRDEQLTDPSSIFLRFCSFRYNKYTSICARATRQALKEEERVKAEKRGYMALRYQEWKDGKAGDQVSSQRCQGGC